MTQLIIAQDIMQSKVLTVGPNMKVTNLASFLEKHKIHGVAVVNHEGKPIGVVSKSDLVQHISKQSKKGAKGHHFYHEMLGDYGLPYFVSHTKDEIKMDGTVRDIMSQRIVAALPSASAGELANLMIQEKVQRILIVDKEQLVGIVASSDLLYCIPRYERGS